jgi:hypothetical protein
MITSCENSDKLYTSPPGYNFAKPVMIKLPGEMNEISGILYNANQNSIVAECDGKGCIYRVSLNNTRSISKWKFGKGKDYEDIVLADSMFYLLKSDGNITGLKFDKLGRIILTDYPFADSSEGNEFEAMYYDTASRNIIFLCKNCPNAADATIPTYAFSIDSGIYRHGEILSLAGIEKDMADEKKIKIKPSAANINPLTGELYVISSIDKTLVIFDKDQKYKSAYKINAKYFKQPEGLTFSPQGDLFISNEGADVGAANILFFQYKSSYGK